jgi:hypothetical protein
MLVSDIIFKTDGAAHIAGDNIRSSKKRSKIRDYPIDQPMASVPPHDLGRA